jgi:hypothetical protein
MKHYVQTWPGIDLMPAIAVLGHGLLRLLWLVLF